MNREGPAPATHANLNTVLSKLESILIRASLRQSVSATTISDVAMDTAVRMQTGQPAVNDIEVCSCPAGYHGTSCEVSLESFWVTSYLQFRTRFQSCDSLYYYDTYDRSVGLLGSCKRCPCSENAESCHMDSDRLLVCNCKQGFYGEQCTDFGKFCFRTFHIFRKLWFSGNVIYFSIIIHISLHKPPCV